MTKTRSQISGYFSVYFTLGVVTASLGPTLPDLAENLSLGIAAISILFTTRPLGYLAGSVISGFLYDRFNGHRLIALMLVLSAASLAIVPNSAGIVVLATVFFLTGVNLGGLDVGANTLLTRARKMNVGPYLNAMFFCAGVGSFLVPLYLGQVSLTWGYRGMALLMVSVALWIYFIQAPEIPPRMEEGEIHLVNYGLFVAFALLAFLFIGAEASYGGWLFTFISNSGLGSEDAAYTLTSVFWFAVMFGRLLAIPLLARFRLERIIVGYLGGAVLSAGMLFFYYESAFAVWIGSIGMGLSLAALFPATYTFVQQKMRLSGKLTGVIWAAGSLGAMTLPWLIGQRIELVGPVSMMTVMLIVWILALGIFLAALRTLPQADSP